MVPSVLLVIMLVVVIVSPSDIVIVIVARPLVLLLWRCCSEMEIEQIGCSCRRGPISSLLMLISPHDLLMYIEYVLYICSVMKNVEVDIVSYL